MGIQITLISKLKSNLNNLNSNKYRVEAQKKEMLTITLQLPKNLTLALNPGKCLRIVNNNSINKCNSNLKVPEESCFRIN